MRARRRGKTSILCVCVCPGRHLFPDGLPLPWLIVYSLSSLCRAEDHYGVQNDRSGSRLREHLDPVSFSLLGVRTTVSARWSVPFAPISSGAFSLLGRRTGTGEGRNHYLRGVVLLGVLKKGRNSHGYRTPLGAHCIT